MRSLNRFTYISTIAVAMSYRVPEHLEAICMVAVALLGLLTVPIAERIRLRASREVATQASQQGKHEGRRQFLASAQAYLDKHDQPAAGD